MRSSIYYIILIQTAVGHAVKNMKTHDQAHKSISFLFGYTGTCGYAKSQSHSRTKSGKLLVICNKATRMVAKSGIKRNIKPCR